MYRSYNSNFDDHFYTPSEAEFLNARNVFGYDDESSGRSGFGITNAQVAGSLPLHRLYNGNTGIHYYTLNQGERDSLVASNTFTSEGIIGYMFPTAAAAVAKRSRRCTTSTTRTRADTCSRRVLPRSTRF